MNSCAQNQNNKNGLSIKKVRSFRDKIWCWWKTNKRSFAWRETSNPWHILVSEIMLQQTQTSRVAEKYLEFLKQFPTPKALARAPLSTVLRAWQGMGYNRRARMLREAARIMCGHAQPKTVSGTFLPVPDTVFGDSNPEARKKGVRHWEKSVRHPFFANTFSGTVPKTKQELEALPGIGPYTASAVMVFAFNRPEPLLETNIRAVYIHKFFPRKKKVNDKDILPLIRETLDTAHPREWFFCLMDYGAYLKKTTINPSRKSARHRVQKKFEGSNRQVRGRIIKALLEKPCTLQEMRLITKRDAQDIKIAVEQLQKENLIAKNKLQYSIK